MPYNPCGRIVDIGTHAYSTECHFFRDSAQAGTIEWREALPDAEPLPFSSGIVNLDWELDKDWIQQPYGEIWGAPRTFNPARPPKGLRGVPCGSVRDFEIGAIYDDERVPIQYTKFGYPLCCGAVVGMLGGAGASGLSLVATNTFVDPTEGGFDLGGEAGDVLHLVDATEGGVELGGEAGDVYTPGTTSLPPGSLDCTTPTVLTLDTVYTGNIGSVGNFQWWTITGAFDGVYHMTITGSVTSNFEAYLCDLSDPCTSVNDGRTNQDGCISVVVPTGHLLGLVMLAAGNPNPITFVISRGLCPVEFVDPTEGGFDLGGEAGDVLHLVDATEGGVELGGEAGDVYTPGGGATCPAAIPLALDSPQSGTITAPGVRWWRCPVPTAGSHLVHGTLSFGVPGPWLVYTGVDCDHLSVLAFNSTTNISVTVSPDSSLILWIEISNFSSNVTYTNLTIDS